jgi:hypothetical protein
VTAQCRNPQKFPVINKTWEKYALPLGECQALNAQNNVKKLIGSSVQYFTTGATAEPAGRGMPTLLLCVLISTPTLILPASPRFRSGKSAAMVAMACHCLGIAVPREISQLP